MHTPKKEYVELARNLMEAIDAAISAASAADEDDPVGLEFSELIFPTPDKAMPEEVANGLEDFIQRHKEG